MAATVDIKVYPESRAKLKRLAVHSEETMAECFDRLVSREAKARKLWDAKWKDPNGKKAKR